jgi:hypothetical protein
MMIYSGYAHRYRHLGILAGNNAALAGIERIMLTENPELLLAGVSIQSFIQGIEVKILLMKIASAKYKETVSGINSRNRFKH